MAKISFVSCGKLNCSEPVYNGLAECAQPEEEVKKVTKFCRKHAAEPGAETCPLHGKEFISYKCN